MNPPAGVLRILPAFHTQLCHYFILQGALSKARVRPKVKFTRVCRVHKTLEELRSEEPRCWIQDTGGGCRAPLRTWVLIRAAVTIRQTHRHQSAVCTSLTGSRSRALIYNMGRADGRLYLGMSPLQDGEGAQRRLYCAHQDLQSASAEAVSGCLMTKFCLGVKCLAFSCLKYIFSC